MGGRGCIWEGEGRGGGGGGGDLDEIALAEPNLVALGWGVVIDCLCVRRRVHGRRGRRRSPRRLRRRTDRLEPANLCDGLGLGLGLGLGSRFRGGGGLVDHVAQWFR